jgi:RNA-directed DNA polymerase
MNLTLDGLERTLQAKFHRGERNASKINIIRYADDFVITGVTREVLVDEVWPVVEQFLAERGLLLSPEKTRVTHIEEGFDFLGMNVRKYDGKLLIKPADTSVQRFLRKLRDVVKGNATARQDWLIRKLNPLIQGWANYYRHVVSKRSGCVYGAGQGAGIRTKAHAGSDRSTSVQSTPGTGSLVRRLAKSSAQESLNS